MYHWWVLARLRLSAPAQPLTFVYGGGPPPEKSDNATLLILGSVEALPLATGAAASLLTDYPPELLLPSGFALTILVCWLLRNKIPWSPIHLKNPPSPPSHDRKT